jgi:hypothetical protein
MPTMPGDGVIRMVQGLQLGIFVLIVIAFIVCGVFATRAPKKKQ